MSLPFLLIYQPSLTTIRPYYKQNPEATSTERLGLVCIHRSQPTGALEHGSTMLDFRATMKNLLPSWKHCSPPPLLHEVVRKISIRVFATLYPGLEGFAFLFAWSRVAGLFASGLAIKSKAWTLSPKLENPTHHLRTAYDMG